MRVAWLRCRTRCYADGDAQPAHRRSVNATILHAPVWLCSAVRGLLYRVVILLKAPMTASASPVVQLSGVRIDRGGRTILRDVSLEVPRGSITAVLGPSGSGKSTMLAALTGELRPVAGAVTLFGNPIPTGSRALLEMRRNVGVLLQGNGLLTDLSVAENVALPLRTHTRLPAAVLQRLVQMK